MLVKEVPYGDPVQTFARLRRRPYSFLLDGGMDPGKQGRYSMIGSDPFLVFRVRGKEVALLEKDTWRKEEGSPFLVLRELMSRYPTESDPRFPVPAGAFGYFAYDLGRQIEALPQIALDDLGLPDCYLGFYDRLLIYDHWSKKTYLTSTGWPERGERGRIRAKNRLLELEKYASPDRDNCLPASLPDHDCNQCETAVPNADVSGSEGTGASAKQPVLYGHFNYDSYCAAVRKVKDYINRGEIQEGILSQRFSCRLQAEPWPIYLRLREINPAPFAAYLHYPELDVICASPERFIKVSGGHVESRPIKGTRPRGRNAREDRQLRAELLNSSKDHAELDLITDLVYRELQQVCRQNSVRVQERFRLEEHPAVFHLVATVCGHLAPGKDLVDLLRATFPAGSISGTPKLRAMEIIEELEPVTRGIYTGSIGYLGFDGNADLNVVIRTMVIKDRVAYLHAGGGIVSDSRPDEEYHETITKARALLTALGHGYKGEIQVCPR